MKKIFLGLFASAMLSVSPIANADWSIKQLIDDSVLSARDKHAVDINNSGQVLIYDNFHGNTYLLGTDGQIIKDFGALGGGSHLNDSGQVAGWFNYNSGKYSPHIFLTGPNGTNFKDLGSFNGTYNVAVDGLNNSGQLALHSFECFACAQHNYITGPNGIGSTELSSLGNFSITGINDKGQLTGLFNDGSPNARQPFITGNNANGLTIIDGFDNRSDDNRAYGINNNNQIVGFTSGFEDGRFLFQNAYVSGPNGEGISNLGTLGGYSSWANAINDSGEVIGISSIDALSTEYHSFLFSHGGITNLGLLDAVVADGWTNIRVSDINYHGQIIGFGDHGDILNTAFLLSYTPDTIFDPQPIFIPDQLPPPPVPEPSTYLMLLAGLGMLGFVGIRKQKVNVN